MKLNGTVFFIAVLVLLISSIMAYLRVVDTQFLVSVWSFVLGYYFGNQRGLKRLEDNF